MLNFGNKEFRNLQEQVLKNMQNIAGLSFGLNIKGRVKTVPELPANAAQGEVYAVGESEPFYFYVKISDKNKDYLNLGTLASTVQGPRGYNGFKGDKGDPGSKIYTGSQKPSDVDGNVNDIYLSPTGWLYTKNKNGAWELVGSLKGSTGPIGNKGDRGIQGPQGDPGTVGPKGDTGFALTIKSVLPSASKLPSPELSQRHDAYVIKLTDKSYLYGLVESGERLMWTNFGEILLPSFGTTKGTIYEGSEGQANRDKINLLTQSLNDKVSGIECPYTIYGKEFMDEIYLDPDQYYNKLLLISIEGSGTVIPSDQLTPYGNCLGCLDIESDRLVVISSQGMFILDRDGNSEMVGNLDDYFTKAETNSAITNSLTNYFTKAETNSAISAAIGSSLEKGY